MGTRGSSTVLLVLICIFLMYDNAKDAISQMQIVPNGGITFIAAADISGYSVATEIQNSAKVLLVSKAICKLRSLDRSPNVSIKSDD